VVLLFVLNGAPVVALDLPLFDWVIRLPKAGSRLDVGIMSVTLWLFSTA